MQETLVVFIQAHDLSHPDWVVMDVEGLVLQQMRGADPEALSALSQNREVIVIVPAEDVLLTSVKMPRMSRSKLMQALPYALEDQLVSEVETLHFVPLDAAQRGERGRGEGAEQDPLPVAVVAKTKMETWIALLKSWHLTPDVMMPLTFTLPLADNTWSLLIDELVVVRTGVWQGFVGDKNTLKDWLMLALHSAETKPASICLWQTETKALPQCAPCDINDIPLKQQTFSLDKLMAALAGQVLHAPRMNLLSGIYQNKKVRYPQKRKLLQVAMGLTMTWLCLLLFYPAVSWFMLTERVNEMNGQIHKIYLRHFPQSTNFVAPRQRMEQKLKKLGSQQNENKFFVILDAVSKAMKIQPDITPKRLDYQNHQLRLDITATSSENFARFADALTQQGWQVKQQNANLAGENINATLIMQ